MPNTTAGAPRFQLHYSSKETLATSVHVSNYGGADIKGGKIDWKVVGLSAGKAHHFVPILVRNGDGLSVNALGAQPA